MELESEKERLRAKGLGVCAISYDSPEILAAFSKRLGITIPLLSDVNSQIIKSFGILNTNYPKGHMGFGVPFPGTYIVDENGVVTYKEF